MKTLATGCEASALEGEGGGLEVQVVLVTVT
jgi:hypothetical protein